VEQARAAIVARNAREQFAVWPENWHAVCIFLDMGSQWRLVPTMTRVIWQGLDYAALPVVMAALKPALPQHTLQPLVRLMPQVRLLEAVGAERRNAK
jgi:hypothetical protein